MINFEWRHEVLYSRCSISIVLAVVCATLMILTLGVNEHGSPWSASAGEPDASIELADNEFDLVVDACNGYWVTSNGTVTIEPQGIGTEVQSYSVSMSIDAGDWYTWLDPYYFEMDSEGGTQPFNWEAYVPTATETGDYTVTISGQVITDPGSIFFDLPPEEAVVHVTFYESPDTQGDIGVPLSEDGTDKQRVRIDGDTVVWTDYHDQDGGGGNNIFLTDSGGGPVDQLTDDYTERYFLTVSEGNAICSEEGRELVLYDLDTGTGAAVDTGLDVRIGDQPWYILCDMDGEMVGILGDEGSNPLNPAQGDDYDVYLHKLGSGESTFWSGEAQTSEEFQPFVSIDDDHLVYSNENGSSWWYPPPARNITVIDLETEDVTTFISGVDLYGPLDMDGGIAVFEEYWRYRIVMLDVTTGEFTPVDYPEACFDPRIDDGRVVFTGYDGEEQLDIYVYDIETDRITQVSRYHGDEWRSDISGNNVVCLSYKGGGTNVFRYDLSYLGFNSPPKIKSVTPDPEVVAPGGECTIRVNAGDPDGDPLSYEYHVTEGTITGEGAIVTWVAPEEEGQFPVQVVVSDGSVRSEPAEAVIEVNEDAGDNTPPVIDSVTSDKLSVVPEGTVIISAEAYDDDGDDLRYIFECQKGCFLSGGKPVSRSSDEWTAPAHQGEFTVTVTAYDGMSYSEKAEMKVMVSAKDIQTDPQAPEEPVEEGTDAGEEDLYVPDDDEDDDHSSVPGFAAHWGLTALVAVVALRLVFRRRWREGS